MEWLEWLNQLAEIMVKIDNHYYKQKMEKQEINAWRKGYRQLWG
jgi:hypothetical protein